MEHTKPIEMERWKTDPHDPGRVVYDGQRTGLEVFDELEYRLKAQGLLPDEYFIIDADWEDGREIPRDADVFVTTDYGGSEGVYLDVYLKWREGGKPVTKSFATGKTLGESGADLDRMHLISSAIIKAFHGEGHSLSMREPPLTLSLSTEEQATVISALIAQREQQLNHIAQTEQLLTRMTGGVLAFVEETGMKPLRLSRQDKAVLAIHEGDLEAFKQNIGPSSKLLIEAAGRPGVVGRKMTTLMLEAPFPVTNAEFAAACAVAVELGDAERVRFLLEQAEVMVPDYAVSLTGYVIDCAYSKCPRLARGLIRQATPEQVRKAPPDLLCDAACHKDWQGMYELVAKGFHANLYAAETFRALISSGDRWNISTLLQDGMEVSAENYAAFHVCASNSVVDACELLLDRGLDFGGYQRWVAEFRQTPAPADVVSELQEYSDSIQRSGEQAEEQTEEQAQGGMTFG